MGSKRVIPEGHSTDIGSEEEGGLDGSRGRIGSEVRMVVQEGGYAREDRRCANQAGIKKKFSHSEI